MTTSSNGNGLGLRNRVSEGGGTKRKIQASQLNGGMIHPAELFLGFRNTAFFAFPASSDKSSKPSKGLRIVAHLHAVNRTQHLSKRTLVFCRT